MESFIAEGFAKQSGDRLEVELGKAGYTKLLGQGQVNKPLRVSVKECSKNAAEKISEAGGEIVLTSKQKES